MNSLEILNIYLQDLSSTPEIPRKETDPVPVENLLTRIFTIATHHAPDIDLAPDLIQSANEHTIKYQNTHRSPDQGLIESNINMKTIRNLQKEHNRQKRLIPLFEIENLPEPDCPDLMESASFHQASRTILQALNALPPNEMLAVRLHYGLTPLGPLPYTAIGQIMGSTEAEAKNANKRGLVELRKDPTIKPMIELL